MNAHSFSSHAAAAAPEMLANWLALAALLALGIVWPPANTVSAATATAAAKRTPAVVTDNAAAQVSRRACLPGIAR